MLSEHTQGLALDIDDTLCHTHIHWARELHTTFGAPHAWEKIAFEYKWIEDYPHWKGHDGVLAWMDRARTSNEVQEEFPLIENANHMVEKIQKIVPIVAYVTARPESVREGTLRWLKKHGFPDVPLIMKPESHAFSEGSVWKATLLHELYPKVQAIVDDRPSLIRAFPAGYQGTVFLYNRERNDDRSDIRVIKCEDWEDVYLRVQEVFG